MNIPEVLTASNDPTSNEYEHALERARKGLLRYMDCDSNCPSRTEPEQTACCTCGAEAVVSDPLLWIVHSREWRAKQTPEVLRLADA